ncbi:MAG: cytochrome C biogenesis protein [Candidatus Marinimicrobia bacterium]|nr:cytochrome C biogenesis protein [Candidatus Neomarinimicrobiota bacterium]|tara:strand:- start:56863 stop:58830 length:1968 start_codon:yes stop_codon:yes gene_type:complete
MTPIVGSITLNLAFGFCILSTFLFLIYQKKGDSRLYHVSRNMVIVVNVLSLLATIILIRLLVVSDLNVDYVAHYTSLETPFFYKITALWAGQSGSLLFWQAVLSVYCLIVVFQNKSRHIRYMPWVFISLNCVQLFFLCLTNFITNPFKPTETDFTLLNGLGLNPLLQNVTMAIHPPTLYLGFVGFTIPFAFVIAGLLNGNSNPLLLKTIRKWTHVAWFFLSCGIILGGWWAYQELGWGGYWAWDPVENASFMPWLTGTAFIHSIMIQEKKNMLRVWNVILITLTFALTIFGTFLTRSGVMSSVHSFTASSLGPLFLGFVIIILVVSISLLVYRLPKLKTSKRLESITSRESGFLFNNVVFVVLCFTVFWGTVFPVISEAVNGTKITVGPPFFNQVNTPIGIFLLGLTGVGPLLAWRKTSLSNMKRNLLIPLLFMIISFPILWYLEYKNYVFITLSLSVFVISAILTEFIRGIKIRKNKSGETILLSIIKMISQNRSRYGGYIVHIGIVFMFVGFTGHAFDKEKEFGLSPGQSELLGSYQFELIEIEEIERPNHLAWIATLKVSENQGKYLTHLYPEKRIYFHRSPDESRRQPHSELDIYSRLNRDIYSVFNAVDIETNIAYFKIMINPLVRWVWIGGCVLAIGALIAFNPRRIQK